MKQGWLADTRPPTVLTLVCMFCCIYLPFVFVVFVLRSPSPALQAGVPWLTAQPSSHLHRERELSSGKVRVKRTRLQFLLPPFYFFPLLRGLCQPATKGLPTGR